MAHLNSAFPDPMLRVPAGISTQQPSLVPWPQEVANVPTPSRQPVRLGQAEIEEGVRQVLEPVEQIRRAFGITAPVGRTLGLPPVPPVSSSWMPWVIPAVLGGILGITLTATLGRTKSRRS